MGQVRRASWAIAIAAALVLSGGVAARADIASDKPAAMLIYPKVTYNSAEGIDTVIRISNTNQNEPVALHCFYLDANSHCSGAPDVICTNDPTKCTGRGACVAGWQEVDFLVHLTAGQPIEWTASDGLLGPKVCTSPAGKPCNIASQCAAGGVCTAGVPIPAGVCERNPQRVCGTDEDCRPFPGGDCKGSNSGTRVPGVPEDPFVGELKCITINPDGTPAKRNDMKGEALLEQAKGSNLDVASYNAIGIQRTSLDEELGQSNELILGGSLCVGGEYAGRGCSKDRDCDNQETDGEGGTCQLASEYNGCPNYLILNHFFEDATNPVPRSVGIPNALIHTNLVLVPCTEDLLRQQPGTAVVQYLVFNEFEQRFSTSRSVTCFEDIRLCNIDTRECGRSIFNVAVAGTLSGQTRINPIGSGLLGVAVEQHYVESSTPGAPHHVRSAAFNLHMQGTRVAADKITIP